MKNICIDIDGTVTDPYFFVPILNKITGQNKANEEYTSNDWIEVYGPEFEEEYEIFDEKYVYTYLEAKPLPHAKQVIDYLLDSGYKISFVTARDAEIEEITRQWLDREGFGEISVYSLSGNANKVSMAKKLNCDLFIEDDPENIKNLVKAGIETIAMDTYYNKNIESDLEKDLGSDRKEYINKKLHRMKDWKEVRYFFDCIDR